MNYFDGLAGTFDTPRRVERARFIANALTARMGAHKGGRALEYGCGTGLIGLQLAPLWDELVLMDASQGMIDALAAKIPPDAAGHVIPVRHDLLAAPYTARFDVIFTSMVLHHMRPVGTAIRAFHEMLAEGGLLCIVDLDAEDGSFHKDEPDFVGYDGFTHAHIRGLFKDAGFTNITVDTFYHSHRGTLAYSLFCAAGTNG